MSIERLPDEPLKAFEVFLTYMELKTPSIIGAYREYTGGSRSSTAWKWAKRYDWEGRRASIKAALTMSRLGAN